MKVHRSQEEWQLIFEEQKELGLADCEMQREYGIPSSTYSKNKQRVKRIKQEDFIKVTSENTKSNQTKLTFPNGLTIEVTWQC